MMEGGLGAEIGTTVDGHRTRDLGLVVGCEAIGAIGNGGTIGEGGDGERGRHRGDTVIWGGCDGAKIIS